eukprot:TRINITY_DN4568_c0_g1_i2.p2 TRINITY_DN4568_c0_g1~~TRINITY_DN4568_c0_g1_i2.p2  ORF type:complete len:179 (+),score=58.69 TRINITY_DN4568_c0_g1_i2:516-1052(+)
MPRQKKQKSEKKIANISSNLAIVAWRVAAKTLGYLTPGSFKTLPNKNTPEHDQVKQKQQELISIWKDTGIPDEHRTKITVSVEQEVKTVAPENGDAPTPAPEKKKTRKRKQPEEAPAESVPVSVSTSSAATEASEAAPAAEKKPRRRRVKAEPVAETPATAEPVAEPVANPEPAPVAV